MFRLSNKKALSQGLKCKVQHLVPGEELEINYSNNSTGQDILNELANQLNLLDKDYFGLKIHDHIQWLDPSKTVVKQTKGIRGEVVFALKFKYYPAEPALLANESTRYYLYLQLRADLLEGRLRSDSSDTLAYLIACALQSEFGDANTSPEISHKENYVADFKFVPNQTEDLELAAIALHQSEDFLGLRPSDVELNFLKKACQLETYGIEPYPVKDSNSRSHFLLGVNYLGISTFQDSKRTNLFVWDEIERISIDGKLVVVYYRKFEKKNNKLSKSRSIFAFRCPSHEHAENFWKIASEHRFFFTLETTPDAPIKTNTGGLFKKNYTLKYVGRVERDLLRDHVDEMRSSGVRRSRSLMARSDTGRMWQGFKQGHSNNDLKSSQYNINASDNANKTFPSNANYFREEEEDEEGIGGLESGQPNQNTNELPKGNRPSVGSASKDQPKAYTRKSTLTSKSDLSSNLIRRGSQVYMDIDQERSDFIRASMILIFILSAIFIAILLMNDTDRPNLITHLLKRLRLEDFSTALRNSYYLPLKSALTSAFGKIFTALDSRLL